MSNNFAKDNTSFAARQKVVLEWPTYLFVSCISVNVSEKFRVCLNKEQISNKKVKM